MKHVVKHLLNERIINVRYDFQIFSVMKKEQPNYLEKISPVIGDCSLPNLGIGEQYQEILKNEVIEMFTITTHYEYNNYIV